MPHVAVRQRHPGLGLAAALALAAESTACGRIGYDLEARRENGRETGGTTGEGGTDAGGNPGAGGAAGGTASLTDGGDASSAGDSDAGGTTNTGGVTGSPDAGDAGTAGHAGLDAGDAAPVCRPVAPDYCTTLPRLPTVPVIDGVLDCGVTLRNVPPQGWNNATTPLPPDSAASYAVAYRPDGIYVFVDVHDATRVPALPADEVWRGDGVEIYVDDDGKFTAAPQFDNPGSRQIQTSVPVDDTTPSTRGELYTWGFDGTREPWTSNFVIVPTASGYAMEAFIDAAALKIPSWSLTAGGMVGLDLGVNVSNPDTTTYTAPSGNRLGQYFLHLADNGDPPFSNVAAFCTPTLGF